MKKYFAILAMGLFLSSCLSLHRGAMTHAGYPDPNFVNSHRALVQVSTTRFLGIGGLGTDALLLEAQRELERLHPLRPGEHFINYTYDYQHQFFPLIDRLELTLSAQVIKAKDQAEYVIPGHDYLESKALRNGDLIYAFYPNPNKAQLLRVVDYEYKLTTNELELSYYPEEGRPKVKKAAIPLHLVYFTQMTAHEKEQIGHDIGEEISLEGESFKIMAHRRKSLLLENQEGVRKFTWPKQ